MKYSLPVVFQLKKHASVEANYSGIAQSNGEPLLEWDRVKVLQYNTRSFGYSLAVTLNGKGVIDPKTMNIKLGGIGKQKDQSNAVVGPYWHRHQVMRHLS